MAKPVLITPHAESDLDAVTLYLFKNWELSVLENFLALYEAKVKIITDYPSRYPFIHQPSGLRKAVLTKHNIILYRETRNILRSSVFLTHGKILVKSIV